MWGSAREGAIPGWWSLLLGSCCHTILKEIKSICTQRKHILFSIIWSRRLIITKDRPLMVVHHVCRPQIAMTPICCCPLNANFFIRAIYAATSIMCLQHFLQFRSLGHTCLSSTTTASSASIFRIWDIMWLFPIKIISRTSCSSSVKVWCQGIGQGGILDAHHAVWVWWKSKTSTYHKVVLPSLLSRHRHHLRCQEVNVVLRWPRWRGLNGEGALLVWQIWWQGDQRIVHGCVFFSIYFYSYLSISLKVWWCLKAQNKINPKWCMNVGWFGCDLDVQTIWVWYEFAADLGVIWVCSRFGCDLCLQPQKRKCKKMLLKIGQRLCNDILSVDVFVLQAVKQWEQKPPTVES